MTLNVKLLKRVAKHIIAEPRRLDMDIVANKSDEAPCGTVGCIAGWSIILNAKKKPEGYRSNYGLGMMFPVYNGQTVDGDEARKILGLSSWEGSVLFYVHQWPSKYRDRYNAAKTDRGRARVAYDRIHHLIKTGE